MSLNLENEGNEFQKLLDFEKLATDFMNKCLEAKIPKQRKCDYTHD